MEEQTTKKRTATKKKTTRPRPARTAKSKAATPPPAPAQPPRTSAGVILVMLVLIVGFVGGFALSRQNADRRFGSVLESRNQTIEALSGQVGELTEQVETLSVSEEDSYASARQGLFTAQADADCAQVKVSSVPAGQDTYTTLLTVEAETEQAAVPVPSLFAHDRYLGKQGCVLYFAQSVDGPTSWQLRAYDGRTDQVTPATLEHGDASNTFLLSYGAPEKTSQLDALLQNWFFVLDGTTLWAVERATWTWTALDEAWPEGAFVPGTIAGPIVPDAVGLGTQEYEGMTVLPIEKYSAATHSIRVRHYAALPDETGARVWQVTDESSVYVLP